MCDLSIIKEKILTVDSIFGIIAERNQQLKTEKEAYAKLYVEYKEKSIKCEELENANEKYKRDIQGLTDDHEKSERTITSLHSNLNTLKVEYDACKSGLKEFMKRETRHLDQLNKLKEKLKEDKKRINELQNFAELPKEKTRRKREELLNEECDKLKSDNEKLRQEQERLAAENTRLSGELLNLQTLKGENVRLNKQNRELQKLMDEKVKTENEGFRSKNRELSENCGRLKEENLKLQEENEKIKMLMDLEKEEFNCKTKEYNVLKGNYEELLNDFKKLNNEFNFMKNTEKGVQIKSVNDVDECASPEDNKNMLEDESIRSNNSQEDKSVGCDLNQMQTDSDNNDDLFTDKDIDIMLHNVIFLPDLIQPIKSRANSPQIQNKQKISKDAEIQTINSNMSSATQTMDFKTTVTDDKQSQTENNVQMNSTQTDENERNNTDFVDKIIQTDETDNNVQMSFTQTDESFLMETCNMDVINANIENKAVINHVFKETQTVNSSNSTQTQTELISEQSEELINCNNHEHGEESSNITSRKSRMHLKLKQRQSSKNSNLTLKKAVNLLKRSKIDITLKAGRLVRYNKQVAIRTKEQIQRRMERNIMDKIIAYINENLGLNTNNMINFNQLTSNRNQNIMQRLNLYRSHSESINSTSDSDKASSVINTSYKKGFDSGYTSGLECFHIDDRPSSVLSSFLKDFESSNLSCEDVKTNCDDSNKSSDNLNSVNNSKLKNANSCVVINEEKTLVSKYNLRSSGIDASKLDTVKGNSVLSNISEDSFKVDSVCNNNPKKLNNLQLKEKNKSHTVLESDESRSTYDSSDIESTSKNNTKKLRLSHYNNGVNSSNGADQNSTVKSKDFNMSLQEEEPCVNKSKKDDTSKSGNVCKSKTQTCKYSLRSSTKTDKFSSNSFVDGPIFPDVDLSCVDMMAKDGSINVNSNSTNMVAKGEDSMNVNSNSINMVAKREDSIKVNSNSTNMVAKGEDSINVDLRSTNMVTKVEDSLNSNNIHSSELQNSKSLFNAPNINKNEKSAVRSSNNTEMPLKCSEVQNLLRSIQEQKTIEAKNIKCNSLKKKNSQKEIRVCDIKEDNHFNIITRNKEKEINNSNLNKVKKSFKEFTNNSALGSMTESNQELNNSKMEEEDIIMASEFNQALFENDTNDSFVNNILKEMTVFPKVVTPVLELEEMSDSNKNKHAKKKSRKRKNSDDQEKLGKKKCEETSSITGEFKICPVCRNKLNDYSYCQQCLMDHIKNSISSGNEENNINKSKCDGDNTNSVTGVKQARSLNTDSSMFSLVSNNTSNKKAFNETVVETLPSLNKVEYSMESTVNVNKVEKNIQALPNSTTISKTEIEQNTVKPQLKHQSINNFTEASEKNKCVDNLKSDTIEHINKSKSNSIKNLEIIDAVQCATGNGSVKNAPLVKNKIGTTVSENKKRKNIPWGAIKNAFNNAVRFKGVEEYITSALNIMKTVESQKLVSYFLHEVMEDKCEVSKGQSPFEPYLSITHRTLIGLLLHLEKSHDPDIVERFMTTCEQQLLFKENDVVDVEQITRIYAAMCKMRRYKRRLKRLILDGLFFMGDRVFPLIYYTLTVWLQVLKRNDSDNDDIKDPFSKILFQVVMMKLNNIDSEYCLSPLKNMLTVYYRYPKERYFENNLLKEFLEIYMCTFNKTYAFAILILCKNQTKQWVVRQVELLDELILIVKKEDILSALKELRQKMQKLVG